MTETSPIGVILTPTPKLAARGPEVTNDVIWARQGRLLFGVELRIVDERGNALPHDGVSCGALQVWGPWTIECYFRSEVTAVDVDGWLNTGDIATVDSNVYLRITDRAKDVIKSGGEWIISIDLENLAGACPGVRLAAVVGVFHPKWEERPILVIEPHEGSSVTAEQVVRNRQDRKEISS